MAKVRRLVRLILELEPGRWSDRELEQEFREQFREAQRGGAGVELIQVEVEPLEEAI